MTILAIIILAIVILMYYFYKKGDSAEYSSWKHLLYNITDKVVRYFFVGGPNKNVYIAIKSIAYIYGLSAISYPLIHAGISVKNGGEFVSAFIACQTDAVSAYTTLTVMGLIGIIMIVYLIRCRFETDQDRELLAKQNEIGQDVKSVLVQGSALSKQLDDLKAQITQIGSGSKDSSSMRAIIQLYEEDINKLKINSAYQHLKKIEGILANNSNQDKILSASLQCLLGTCARYIKDVESKPYYSEAYRLIKLQPIIDKGLYIQILEGLIYVACGEKDMSAAGTYVEELRVVAPEDIWCYVPELITTDTLNAAYQSIPMSVPRFKVLTNAIMIGCKAQDYELGENIETYRYQGLTELSYDNYPLWVYDMSVAATRFVRQFASAKQLKSLWNKEAEDLYNLTHRYLELLDATEMDNLMRDTVFLENLTGYIKDQDGNRLALMEQEKGKVQHKELYYLGYALMLMDQGMYPEALALLKEYGSDAKASILNMRLVIGIRTRNEDELAEVVKELVERQEDIPNHLLPNFMQALNNVYDRVKEYAKDMIVPDARSKMLLEQFVLYKEGKSVDIELLKKEEKNIAPELKPFLAMIYQKAISTDRAIALLRTCEEPQEPDLRTFLLIQYYSTEKKYTVDLYHLLQKVRKSGVLEDELLWQELLMADAVHDSKAVAKISSHLLAHHPDDPLYLCYRVKALRALESNELAQYKSRIQKADISDLRICRTIVSIYLSAHDYDFAVEYLYERILKTKDQRLKDFFFHLTLNRKFSNYVCAPKEQVEMGDWVKIKNEENEEEEIEITPGATYAGLIGTRVGEKKVLRLSSTTEVTVIEVHNKYFKLFKDIHTDISQHKSPSIVSVSLDEKRWHGDPMAAIQAIAGNSADAMASRKTLLEQYKRMEIPLCVFIKDEEPVASMLNTLYGKNFAVYNMSTEVYRQITQDGALAQGREVVPDLSSLIVLYDYSKRYGYKPQRKLIIPISLQYLLRETLVQEDIGKAAIIEDAVCEAFKDVQIDKTQSLLWNIVNDILQWVDANCQVVIVEDKLNMSYPETLPRLFFVNMDSVYIASRGGIFMTEDWGLQRFFSSEIATIDAVSWLRLMGKDKADEMEAWMKAHGYVRRGECEIYGL